MGCVWVANSSFEHELREDLDSAYIVDCLESFPFFLQLQFLPLLFADRSDCVVVTELPDRAWLERRGSFAALPQLVRFGEKCCDGEVKPWGVSSSFLRWVKGQSIEGDFPSWDSVKKINSKEFVYNRASRLEGTSLLRDEAEVREWLKSLDGEKLIKSCFGVAARGNRFVREGGDECYPQLCSFLEEEWRRGYPVIGEPWVERVLDFSTQWEILKSGEICYVGSVILKNNFRGQYLSTIVGEEEELFKDYASFLKEHKEEALKILREVYKEGYFGAVGIDAMIYRNPISDEKRLHPIVELNGRMTMSSVAIACQQKHFPGRKLSFYYARSSEADGYLPTCLCRSDGNEVKFSHQLYINIDI